MAVTLKDVAKRSGVSTMTVSRVITKTGYASPAARARVEQAIVDLGYVPNALARHLRSKRTRTLALVMSDITNPFFTTIARGVQDVATARDFAVMFCNTDESEAKELECLEMLIGRQIEGVLLVPAGKSQQPLKLLRSHHVPVVVLDRRVSSSVDQVRSDSEAGAYQLVSHLLSLGHTRVAILDGRLSIPTASDRAAGYRRALREHAVPFDSRLVLAEGFSVERGYSMACRALSLEPRPTALFAANSFIAFGALRALREAGLEVPADMSLVCFDDLPSGWLVDPFLTVVDQDAYQIGCLGTETILGRLDGSDQIKPSSMVLPVEFVQRRSTAAPSGAASMAGR